MATELQKLARVVAQIKKGTPVHGRRYSTVVENPFESGYWPPVKPTKRDLALVNRWRKIRGLTTASSQF